MYQLFRRHLYLKLALFMVIAIAAGFSLSVTGTARIQAETIEDMHRDSARSMATSLAAGVRNSMLTGNGSSVRELLDDAKGGIKAADVRVFAPSGEEVFGKKPPAPPPEAQPPHVRACLATKKPQPAGDAKAVAIENEERCRSCHKEGELRGVLTLGTKGARTPIDGSDTSLDALSKISNAAFVQIMTAKHEDKLDDYFEELVKKTPGLVGAAVYSTVAERKFGGDPGIPDAVVLRAMTPQTIAFTHESNGKKFRVLPLRNETRCQGCHSPKEEMRGALVVAFDAKALDAERTLVMASDTSLRHVMLAGLGRMIVGFMDEVAATGAVTTLSVHDDAGRIYHDAFAKPSPPKEVGTVLQTHQSFESPDTATHPEFVFALPLANDKKCQRCHGPDLPLRGALEIRLDTTKETVAVARLKQRSLLFAGITILFVVALLGIVIRWAIVLPVQKIGSVADRVGAGNFDAHVEVNTVDEIGRLAKRINDMVTGLRQKLALSKFVSQATLETVESRGVATRGGVRERVTVLFSDIRGFTAYSETRSPEQVVEMLNEYLQVQADVVVKHGGDIDKFVGDELMARFTGKDMELRAARCGIEMIAAVDTLNAKKSEKTLSIGIGVNAGDVVYGAMGAEHRLDFTVIGDSVNLAARLCSAAKGGEVIITKTIRDALEGVEGVTAEELEPIKVKGKADAIAIYRAAKK